MIEAFLSVIWAYLYLLQYHNCDFNYHYMQSFTCQQNNRYNIWQFDEAQSSQEASFKGKQESKHYQFITLSMGAKRKENITIVHAMCKGMSTLQAMCKGVVRDWSLDLQIKTVTKNEYYMQKPLEIMCNNNSYQTEKYEH